jgi:hypothetical protein
MTSLKRYARLRPDRPTRADERCSCSRRHPVKLSAIFCTTNPLHCAGCCLELEPERFNLGDDQVRALAHWASLGAAFDRLWLDSDAYEAFARRELESIESRISQLGLDAARSVNRMTPCYFELPFPEPSEPGFVPLARCPACRTKLRVRRYGSKWYRACDRCRILSLGDNPISRTMREIRSR